MSVQGSEEWLMERLGRATASEFHSILAKGERKMRTSYLRRIAAERLTGKPIEGGAYGNWQKNLERGHEQEPFARMAYEARTGNLVEEVGFIPHAKLMAGASPDGLIGIDGGCEIKSVIPTVQLATIDSQGYPPEHKAQIQGSLWITGRSWWDFCSYCHDYKEENPNLACYIFRVQRDEPYIATLSVEVTAFLAEVDAYVAQKKSYRSNT